MAGIPRILRSRGALTGIPLIALGAWGGLAPLIGPYFHYAYTPGTAWHFTLARLWLELLPALATVLGGALVMVSTRRLVAGSGAILAVLADGWFAVGNTLPALWPELGAPGVPAGTSATRMALEELGLFTGLGAVIIFCAALTAGRCFAAAARTETGEKPADAHPAGQDEPDTAATADPDTAATADLDSSSAGTAAPPA